MPRARPYTLPPLVIPRRDSPQPVLVVGHGHEPPEQPGPLKRDARARAEAPKPLRTQPRAPPRPEPEPKLDVLDDIVALFQFHNPCLLPPTPGSELNLDLSLVGTCPLPRSSQPAPPASIRRCPARRRRDQAADTQRSLTPLRSQPPALSPSRSRPVCRAQRHTTIGTTTTENEDGKNLNGVPLVRQWEDEQRTLGQPQTFRDMMDGRPPQEYEKQQRETLKELWAAVDAMLGPGAGLGDYDTVSIMEWDGKAG